MKAAMLSRGGVCRLARKTNSITKSRKASSAQPNHAICVRRNEIVSSRRSGLIQKSLFGRLMAEAGIAAMSRGTPNEMSVAKTMTISSTNKNAAFVCQALAKPLLPKCDPTISGSCCA